MRFLLLLAIGFSTPPDVAVNRYAVVQSADGYLNVRNTASTALAPRHRLDNGHRVWVRSCASERQGRRWCHVSIEYGPDTSMGYVYDAELSYETLRPTRQTAKGAGVADGLVWRDGLAVVASEDGYLNLRAGPSSRHRVLRRLGNDDILGLMACQPANQRGSWCLVETDYYNVVGYVYDAELHPVDHDH